MPLPERLPWPPLPSFDHATPLRLCSWGTGFHTTSDGCAGVSSANPGPASCSAHAAPIAAAPSSARWHRCGAGRGACPTHAQSGGSGGIGGAVAVAKSAPQSAYVSSVAKPSSAGANANGNPQKRSASTAAPPSSVSARPHASAQRAAVWRPTAPLRRPRWQRAPRRHPHRGSAQDCPGSCGRSPSESSAGSRRA